MKVLVTGATGRQGGSVARHLQGQGHHVVALTRDATSPAADALRQLDVEVVEGDLEDTDGLQRQLNRVDAAFSVTAPGSHHSSDLEWRQGSAMAAAAQKAGLQHLVFSSATFSPTNRFKNKLLVEQHLKDLDLPWTVVAPAMFMDNLFLFHRDDLPHGRFRLPIRESAPIQWISAHDIGMFVAYVMARRDEFVGQRIQIAADELRGPEIADILSRHVGIDVSFEGQPLAEFDKQGLVGQSGFDYWNCNHFPVDIPYLRKRFPGPSWLSYEEWVQRQDWTWLRPQPHS